MTADEVRSAVETAHNKGIKVCAHLGSAKAVKMAVQAGIDCVEHGYLLDEEAVGMMAERAGVRLRSAEANRLTFEEAAEADLADADYGAVIPFLRDRVAR